MLVVSPAAVPRFSSEPKSGETPCGRHGFPEMWEEFRNSFVSYPKPTAVAGMGEIPTRHEPLQAELEEKQTRGIEVHRFY